MSRRIVADGNTTRGTAAVTAPLGRMLLAQTRCELAVRWRIAAFSFVSLALPLLFYTFFALPVAHLTRADGVSVGAFLAASFGAYAVGSVMVNAFGVGVAVERAMKVDLLTRVTPLPPAVHLLAKVITTLVFALSSVVALIAYAIVAGGVSQPPRVWGILTLSLLVGSVPFIGLGLAIGYASGPSAAPAVANLVYLPLSFASGLFLPSSQLPPVVQRIAPYLPTYHAGQLAWSTLGASSIPWTVSLAWLAAYTLAFFALALLVYRREAREKFS
jgi:ABC-2 type transport system permease protein